MNNKFHRMIMIIEVVLYEIDEEINYVSVIHNHVTLHMVQIWLCNRPAKLRWNHNKNRELQISRLELYSLITLSVKLLWFCWNIILLLIIFVKVLAKSLVIWSWYRLLDSQQIGSARWGINEDDVIFLGFIERNTIAVDLQRC